MDEKLMNELSEFIWKANQAGYGAEDRGNREHHNDGGTIITFVEDSWRMVDHFYGGEPYSGMTVVFHNGVACWSMVYHGFVVPGIDKEVVYKTLRPALLKMPKDNPFRGPELFEGETGIYSNYWDGALFQFAGLEEIRDSTENLMFHTKYIGGVINQA